MVRTVIVRVLILLSVGISTPALPGAAAAQFLDLIPLRPGRVADPVESSWINPAALASHESTSLSLWYRSYYSISDLSSTGIRYRSRLMGAGFGIEFSDMGIRDLRRLYLRPSVGIRFGSPDSTRLDVGLSLTFDRLASGDANVIHRSARFGLIAPVGRSTVVGIVLNRSISSSGLRSDDGDFVAGGLRHRISDRIATTIDYYFFRRFNEQYFFGFDFTISSGLSADIEWSQNPGTTLLQIRFARRQFLVHLAGSRHEVLGWSKSVSISFLQE